MALKLPGDWIPKQILATADVSTEVTARVDMSEEVAGAGLCPECKAPMEHVFLGDNEVLACIHDRIVLPIKDVEVLAPVLEE